MKKVFGLLMFIFMLMVLASCGNKEINPQDSTTTNTTIPTNPTSNPSNTTSNTTNITTTTSTTISTTTSTTKEEIEVLDYVWDGTTIPESFDLRHVDVKVMNHIIDVMLHQ